MLEPGGHRDRTPLRAPAGQAYIDQIDAHIEGATTMEVMNHYHDAAKAEAAIDGGKPVAASTTEPFALRSPISKPLGYAVIYAPDVQR